MRRTSPFRGNIPPRPKRFVSYAIFAVLAVLVAVQLVFPSVLPNVLYQFAVPFERARLWTAEELSFLGTYFASKTYLEQQNTLLRQQVESAQEQLLRLSSLEKELSAVQSLSPRSNRLSIITGVLAGPPFSPYDTLVLEAGSSDGVAVGAMVRSAGGTGIGKISEVFPDFSRATLFSSPGYQVPVLLGSNALPVTAQGVGGGVFQVVIPREVEISVGDPVTFPGISPTVVGVVSSVVHQEVDFLQLISFRSPVNVSELRYVSVDVSATSSASKIR